jgi:protease-4
MTTNKDKKKAFVRGLQRAWRGVEVTKRVVFNILFIAIIVAVIVAIAMRGPKVPDSTALIVDPKGAIVEQVSGGPMEKVLSGFSQAAGETALKDIVDAIDSAKDDERVKVLFLELSDLNSASLSILEDVGRVIANFKKSGKKVIASTDSYNTINYYLATFADEVHLHPEGMLLLDGFGRFSNYFKDGLDKFEIEPNIFRVGEFKSAVEPFLRNDMSEEAKLANMEYLKDMWESYVRDVAVARGLEVKNVNEFVDLYDQLLSETGGDSARLALESRLVDTLSGRDDIRNRLMKITGEDEETHSFYQIGFNEYLDAMGGDRTGATADGDLVAIVVAAGMISDGEQPPGSIGGDSTAALIHKARKDENVKAIVMRVDSPGGSGYASEIIRKECELARAEGKPVIISMGGLAASGGYWISSASDEIWASPNTITGSIGIFGLLPTFNKPLAKYLGVNVDGVGTTWMYGAYRPDRELEPRFGNVIRQIIDKGYADFLEVVANGRHMTTEEVDKVARGRVWSGADALEIGLVDKLGSLQDAVESAAKLAKLGDKYKTKYIEKEPDFKERMLANLASVALDWLGSDNLTSKDLSFLAKLLGVVQKTTDRLKKFNDPNGIYAHCLCEME